MSKSVDTRYFRGHPYYGTPETVTAAAMAAAYAIGPLTLEQAQEILWRVKSFIVTWSYTDTLDFEYPYHASGTDAVIRFTDEDDDGPVAADEYQTFKRIETPLNEVAVAFVTPYTTTLSVMAFQIGGKLGKDEHGDYWFPDSSAYVGLKPDDADYFGSIFGYLEPDPVYASVSVATTLSLPLASGALDLVFYLSFGSVGLDSDRAPGSPVMSATMEWHAYADLSGAPAWNTATGLIANGGPGG